MATHSNILAWRILWTEEHGRLQSVGSKRVGHVWTTQYTYPFLLLHIYSCICWNIEDFKGGFRNSCGEGTGTPLQYSCLENPMDGGAWQAAVHGVAKSQTRLSDFTFTFIFMHGRRKWPPTAVFLPGESHGRGSLVGCRLWRRTESDTTEATQQQQQLQQEQLQ